MPIIEKEINVTDELLDLAQELQFMAEACEVQEMRFKNYIANLEAKIADLLSNDPAPNSWPKGAGLHYCEHCQQASHDHEWVELTEKFRDRIAKLRLALAAYGHHEADCGAQFHVTGECYCGLLKVFEETA